MSTLPFTGKIAAVLGTVTALAIVAAACAGGGKEGEDGATPGVSEISPVIVNSELVVGENRLMIGLLDSDNQEVTGAQVALRFFKLDGQRQDLRGEAQATPITLEKTYTHTHDDGTVETHSAGESGVYVAAAQFDEAGQWGVEVTTTVDDRPYEHAGLSFNVLEKSISVPVGAPAPLSETLTLDDVADVTEIDTSDPPIPEMHTMTIAEAVTSGRPSVITFATPAFCLSRICGPTKEAVDALYAEYGDTVNFVHVEPYDVERARTGEGLFPVEATQEWGLRSEPWVFLVDGDGKVAARFEAVVTLEELQRALQPLVGG